jgi:hypothetical protein
VEDALSRNSQFALLISEFAFVVANLFLAAKNKAPMDKDYPILKRASASRPSGEWNDDDYDVFANGVVVGRIMKANAAPVDAPWLWTPVIDAPVVRLVTVRSSLPTQPPPALP